MWCIFFFQETGSYPTQPRLVQTHKHEPHTRDSWFLLLSSIPVISTFKSVLEESFSLVLLYSQLIFPRSDVVCGSWREEAVRTRNQWVCLLAFITLLELNHISPSLQFYFCASVSTFTCEFQVCECHGMCGGQRITFYLVCYWVCCASWATSTWDPPASHLAAEHFSLH